MKTLYDIVLAYELIGGSTLSLTLHTDVESPVETMSLYKTSTTFVMACSSVQPYIVR